MCKYSQSTCLYSIVGSTNKLHTKITMIFVDDNRFILGKTEKKMAIAIIDCYVHYIRNRSQFQCYENHKEIFEVSCCHLRYAISFGVYLPRLTTSIQNILQVSFYRLSLDIA